MKNEIACWHNITTYCKLGVPRSTFCDILFGFGDGTGPAEDSKRTKRVQGWSRQIGLGTLFAIHTKLFST